MLTKICMIYNAAYNTYRNLTSVVSTLTGSVYFSVAVPSNEKKQMWGQFSYLFKEKSHTHVNVLLVTRFRWLRPNLGLSHHSLFLLFLFFLACSILMSLCSVKVTTKQHFVQNVLQWLVWNKDSVTSQKTKRWLNNTQIHELINCVCVVEDHKPWKTYTSSLPQPCLGPQAVPISVVRPLHIDRSTCKLHNRVKIQFGSMISTLCFNLYNHWTSKNVYALKYKRQWKSQALSYLTS